MKQNDTNVQRLEMVYTTSRSLIIEHFILNCKMYTGHSIWVGYNPESILKLRFVIVNVFILYIV